MKKWRIHIWIILPSVLPMKDGKFPEKWETIDIFPETKLYGRENIHIFLRKNHHVNRKQSNYLLEAKIDAENSTKVLELLGDKVETILDLLTFQLQTPIHVTYLEVIDHTQPLKVGEERECVFAASYPRVQKDSHFEYMANWKTSINPKLMQEKLDANVEAALRWFSKGIASYPIVDQFTSFWIALEILTTPGKPRKKRFFQCRKCNYEIESCPKCSYSTLHFPETKERIEAFVSDLLGMNETTFEKLWDTRMIFHGRNRLTSEEINKISEVVWELRMILVRSLKKKLGLDEKDEPHLISLSASIMDKFIMGGSRKLTTLDVEYAKAFPEKNS